MKNEDIPGKTRPFKAHEMLLRYGVEKCEECHNPVSDDWQFKDFSNKNIVICSQCKTEYYLEELQPKCAHCQELIEKKNGKWVHSAGLHQHAKKPHYHAAELKEIEG